jgi:hypothetical protein
MLVLSLTLAACNPKDQMPVLQSNVGAQQTGNKLNSRIPPPNPSKYKDVQDAQDWQNPYLLIRPEGFEVILKNASVERQIISCDELTSVLVSLPDTAWPYGRVVAAQEIGIRSGGRKDERAIAENKARVEKILAALDVKVDLWPS